MFEQSLMEIAARNGRKKWTVLASGAFQCLLLGILIVLPLLHIDALPKLFLITPVEPPSSGVPVPPPPQPTTRNAGSQSEAIGKTVIAPAHIPDKVASIEELEPLPPNPGPVVLQRGVEGGVPGGTGTNFLTH